MADSGAQDREGADLKTAARVLRTEAHGLMALADSLGPPFVGALDAIENALGRVVVTGMGKSGHIARKIAATLASTGTPAFFVHPGEASHGDLGMVTRADVVVALSNSGETPELADMVDYAKRFDIPLIVVVGQRSSTLAEAADMVLLLPQVDEACPMGLAPTTSTTLMMALGDALAVALLERRGFSAADFKVFHPGGRLGVRLVKVSDLMATGGELPLVPATALMAEALIVMTEKSKGCVGVVGPGGALEGVITDGDLRRHMAPGLPDMKAREVMTVNAATIQPTALASEAVAVMNARKITNLFVVEDGRAVGILHIHDCLRAGVA